MHVHLPHYPPERFVRESENGVYGAAVACIDWVTDVLLHELKALGLDDNTLVLFTSDNGSRAREGAAMGRCAPPRARPGKAVSACLLRAGRDGFRRGQRVRS